MVEEVKVTVSQFLTKPNSNYPDKKPVPLRIMFGYVTQESQKGIYVKVRARMEPSTICYVCGRKLTHPVSLFYAIGPECGGHFHKGPLPFKAVTSYYEDLRAHMGDVTWEGWLPKAYVKIETTGETIEPFLEVKEVPKKEKEQEGEETGIPGVRRIAIKTAFKYDPELVDELAAELGI